MLCLVKMPPLLDSPFVTNLHLKTNASAGLDIPVSVFTGRVAPIWNDFIKLAEEDPDDGLNNSTDHSIGWLTEGSSKELYLAIWNPNPIGVSLQGWGTNCSNAIITYLGSENGSPMQFKARSHYTNLTMATTLRPESYAVFQVQVQMPRDNEEEEEPVDRCAGPSPTALAVHVRTIFETVNIDIHIYMCKKKLFRYHIFLYIQGCYQPTLPDSGWSHQNYSCTITMECQLSRSIFDN